MARTTDPFQFIADPLEYKHDDLLFRWRISTTGQVHVHGAVVQRVQKRL